MPGPWIWSTESSTDHRGSPHNRRVKPRTSASLKSAQMNLGLCNGLFGEADSGTPNEDRCPAQGQLRCVHLTSFKINEIHKAMLLSVKKHGRSNEMLPEKSCSSISSLF